MRKGFEHLLEVSDLERIDFNFPIRHDRGAGERVFYKGHFAEDRARTESYQYGASTAVHTLNPDFPRAQYVNGLRSRALANKDLIFLERDLLGFRCDQVPVASAEIFQRAPAH